MMINITSDTERPFAVIQDMISTHVPTVIGISTESGTNYKMTIHLPDDASASHQNRANKIFDNWGNLNLTASTTTMAVGDTNPTITYDTGDSELNYVILLDGNVYASGTETVIAGTLTLELDSPEAGTYEIYVYRLSGNFASGFVSIIVSEE